MTVRLTAYSHGAGCGCKLSPAELHEVMGRVHLPPAAAEVLVGVADGDDAGVYLLTPDTALIATTDFFTPVVDDAHDWGRIAAANALSDVYAMGGRPLFGLNLAAWPRDLDFSLLAAVLDGGCEVATGAGCAVLGGHTIDDPEPKFGMAVVGVAHPDRIVTTAGARPGDHLWLTKAIGTGIITTAAKRDAVDPVTLAAAVTSMSTTNAQAAEGMVAAGAHAATDVTGFGLLGHLANLARASGLRGVVHARAVPLLDGARELAEAGFVPGGTTRNLASVTAIVDRGEVDDVTLTLLADAQTSGGLLVALPPGIELPGAAHVGRLDPGPAGTVRVEA
jgi:selenide,water dikinase